MAVRPGGRAARTTYRVLSSWGVVSMLEVHPETGRTHQIRVHLSHLGHAIVGDRLYGGRRGAGSTHPGLQEALEAFGGLGLHARRLAFAHPRSGEWREFEAPRPPDLQRLVRRLEALGGGAPPAARARTS
jgi:23S rRNA pseudouridine1911/1915/1917 synthase